LKVKVYISVRTSSNARGVEFVLVRRAFKSPGLWIKTVSLNSAD
jgi:hypothetical protein